MCMDLPYTHPSLISRSGMHCDPSGLDKFPEAICAHSFSCHACMQGTSILVNDFQDAKV